jgi:hypothetical protein
VGAGVFLRSGNGELGAGDCLEVVQDQVAPGTDPGAAPLRHVGCNDPKAAYVLGVRLANPQADCPAEIYTVHRDRDRTLCLMYNVREGECFLESPLRTGPFDCVEGHRAGAIKILKRVDGTTNPDLCEAVDSPGVVAAVVPEPATTFCYVDFGAGERPPVAT